MPLPEPWFRVRDAVANGHSRGSLKSRRLEVPFYGVRARAGFVANVEQLCAAYAEKIAPDAAFTGVTAARLWQMPLPAYLGFDIRMVDVAARSPRRSPRGMNVNGSQYDPHLSHNVSLRGLPVLSAVDTWCSLATVLDPMDLVAVADHLVKDRPARRLASSSLEELRRAVGLRRGSRGQVRLRWALDQVRPRAWSRTESLTRLVLASADSSIADARLRSNGRSWLFRGGEPHQVVQFARGAGTARGGRGGAGARRATGSAWGSRARRATGTAPEAAARRSRRRGGRARRRLRRRRGG